VQPKDSSGPAAGTVGQMQLRDALRSTGAVRHFTDQPVDDATVASILDTARFAPSGGNRQGWRVVVVRDGDQRRAIRDLYLPGWYDYLAIGAAGLVAWAPVTDRHAEQEALQAAPAIAARAAAGGGGFAEHLDTVPVLMVVLADLRALAATDRDFERNTLVGGASVFPFVWSILLAAHDVGLGGVMTSMLTRREVEVRAALGAPDHFAVAAGVALGHPVRRATRLRRAAVPQFATYDTFDGIPVAVPDA
jgi:nitroreductase